MRRLCRCGRPLAYELVRCVHCKKADERAKSFRARYERLNKPVTK